jgi:hypothetical protein
MLDIITSIRKLYSISYKEFDQFKDNTFFQALKPELQKISELVNQSS